MNRVQFAPTVWIQSGFFIERENVGTKKKMPLKEITMIFLVALREHLSDKTKKGMEVRVI